MSRGDLRVGNWGKMRCGAMVPHRLVVSLLFVVPICRHSLRTPDVRREWVIMKRGVWFGSAVLSLGGCLGGLTAQEAPRQPEPVNLTGAELRSVPIAVSVSIGRPVPIAST